MLTTTCKCSKWCVAKWALIHLWTKQPLIRTRSRSVQIGHLRKWYRPVNSCSEESCCFVFSKTARWFAGRTTVNIEKFVDITGQKEGSVGYMWLLFVSSWWGCFLNTIWSLCMLMRAMEWFAYSKTNEPVTLSSKTGGFSFLRGNCKGKQSLEFLYLKVCVSWELACWTGDKYCTMGEWLLPLPNASSTTRPNSHISLFCKTSYCPQVWK